MSRKYTLVPPGSPPIRKLSRKWSSVRIGDHPPGTPNCSPHQSWKRALACYRHTRVADLAWKLGRQAAGRRRFPELEHHVDDAVCGTESDRFPCSGRAHALGLWAAVVGMGPISLSRRHFHGSVPGRVLCHGHRRPVHHCISPAGPGRRTQGLYRRKLHCNMPVLAWDAALDMLLDSRCDNCN